VEEPLPSPFERHFVWLCSLLIIAALVSSLADVATMLRGNYAAFQVAPGLRLLREGIYSILLVDFAFVMAGAKDRPMINRGALLIAVASLVWIVLAAFYSNTLNLPPVVILSGLRFLEYIPLSFISAVVYLNAGSRPFRKIAKIVFLFLLAETLIGFIETRLALNIWGTTFLGRRAFGTLPSPNIFGAATLFSFLLIRAALPPRWYWPAFVLATFDVFASGSRAAVLGLLIGMGANYYGRITNAWARMALLLASAVVSPAMIILVSAPEITGRGTGLGEGGFERLGVWSRVLTNINSVAHMIIGWGTGLGSNTVFSLYGGLLKGNYVSDNTFFFLVGSFGIVGVLIFVSVFAILAWILADDPPGLAIVIALLLMLLISQALETYPLNVLATIMLGWRVAVVRDVRRRAAYDFILPNRSRHERFGV
jgi:hypothetical protein